MLLYKKLLLMTFGTTYVSAKKQCIERQVCCMKSGIKNQEAVYWENFNLGDILWGMPVLYMPGTANCIARLVNKSGIHTIDNNGE